MSISRCPLLAFGEIHFVSWLRVISSSSAAMVRDGNSHPKIVIGMALLVLPYMPAEMPSPTVSAVPFFFRRWLMALGDTPSAAAASFCDGYRTPRIITGIALKCVEPLPDGFKVSVIWSVSFDPQSLVFVYSIWPNLVAVFAKWDDIEITRFCCSVSIANHMMRIGWPCPATDDARQLLDAVQMFFCSFCSAFWFWFFQAKRGLASQVHRRYFSHRCASTASFFAWS